MPLTVRIHYRNYKPLHDLYVSFQVEPPTHVEFIIPQPNRWLGYFLPLHHRAGHLLPMRMMTTLIQEVMFKNRTGVADVEHFAQMMPSQVPGGPYVVDFEHVVSLADFAPIDAAKRAQIFRFLSDENCCGIMPLSEAAHDSLRYLLSPEQYEEVAAKTQVIYPAVPKYSRLPLAQEGEVSKAESESRAFRLLFVGAAAYRKGLHELLLAFSALEEQFEDIRLDIISKVPGELRRMYRSPRITYHRPTLTHEEIIERFFIPADLFVMPTHVDTFGMAFLYALASGTPVLTTEQFAAKEIVRPGQNGMFVQSNRLYLELDPLPSRGVGEKYFQPGDEEKLLVSQIKEKIEYLYHNRMLVREMGRKATKDFEPGGRFAVGTRNENLEKVYRSCCEVHT